MHYTFIHTYIRSAWTFWTSEKSAWNFNVKKVSRKKMLAWNFKSNLLMTLPFCHLLTIIDTNMNHSNSSGTIISNYRPVKKNCRRQTICVSQFLKCRPTPNPLIHLNGIALTVFLWKWRLQLDGRLYWPVVKYYKCILFVDAVMKRG